MIRKVKDLDEFYLVTVKCDWGSYQVLYFKIPQINQIQSVASTIRQENWETDSGGSRTTLEKLPKTWSVSVDIEEIKASRVASFCPAALECEYSLSMLEDMRIRRSWKYERYLEMEKNVKKRNRMRRL